MQRLTTTITIMALMAVQACGGVELDSTAQLHAQLASPALLERDLPGCEVLTAEELKDQQLSLLQHPAASDLVVLMAGSQTPLCVDTVDGVRDRLVAVGSLAAGTPMPGVLPELSSGNPDGGQNEQGNENEEAKGDPDTTPTSLKKSLTVRTRTLFSDDPLPIFLTASK